MESCAFVCHSGRLLKILCMKTMYLTGLKLMTGDLLRPVLSQAFGTAAHADLRPWQVLARYLELAEIYRNWPGAAEATSTRLADVPADMRFQS